jgi:hypothetical protein
MKADNLQLNVSEVSYARKSGGGKGGEKRSSSGISNNSNGDVADRLFDKHEYHTMNPEQKKQPPSETIKTRPCWKWSELQGRQEPFKRLPVLNQLRLMNLVTDK